MSDQQNEHQPQRQKAKKTSGFAQYSLTYQLYKAIMVNGLKAPMPVQKKAIPVLMEGKDAIICYKTGSGKTLSYMLPMINRLRCHSNIVGARGLIIIPTKDLAEQITKVLKLYIRFTDLRYTLLLGGHTFEGQFESLAGNPDIIIATPGRLMQLLMEAEHKLLGRVEMLVFDEADNLFEGGFQTQLKEILQRCPVSQRVMLSATINDSLNEFASSCLREYSYIHQEVTLPDTMSVDFFLMRSEEKLPALLYFLENITKTGKIIVFTATRYHVDFLIAAVGEFYECFGIYGKMDMDQRTDALQKFKRKKKLSILIVTDVAARGLDIPSVQYVLHFDYPTNHKTFIHRSGRTARKGQSGSTLAFVTHHELPYMTQLSGYVARPLSLSDDKDKSLISYGSLPPGLVDRYSMVVKKLKENNQELAKLDETANKAFDKFKRCRTQASQNSVKKAKVLEIRIHRQFKNQMADDTQQLISRIHNFIPRRSFLELQKINNEVEVENDPFLGAVEKFRKDQTSRRQLQLKKERLRERNSKQWQEILSKDEIKSLGKYKDQMNRKKQPIQLINGVEIEVESTENKSRKQDFKNYSQYISEERQPGVRTEFDDLPRIKSSEIDFMVKDENPRKKSMSSKRTWDKTKKDFVWKKDHEDKMSKEQKGKKAYAKWKKESKMSIPKVGQMEDQQQTKQAKGRWLERRKFRHGWKETVEKTRLPKNNKTKAIEKKFKKTMIKKSQKSKGRPGK